MLNFFRPQGQRNRQKLLATVIGNEIWKSKVSYKPENSSDWDRYDKTFRGDKTVIKTSDSNFAELYQSFTGQGKG